MTLRCDQQRCDVCGDVGHFLDFPSTGRCLACTPVEIVASIEAPRPSLKAFDEVDESLEPTTELMVPNEWMSELIARSA